MKSEMETVVQLQAKASWRVAVSQGLTLLGFNEWVEHTNYPCEIIEEGESDPVTSLASEELFRA